MPYSRSRKIEKQLERKTESFLNRFEKESKEIWEKSINNTFEELYIEFADRVCELPIECILKKEVLDLLNALSVDVYHEYQEVRLSGDNVVFSTAINDLYVCDENGNVICKGKLEAEKFTGYKCTYDYDGEYVDGKRHGKGKEYCRSVYDNYSKFLLRDGIWEHDVFTEGRINGVLVEIVNGVVEFVQGTDGDIVTKSDWDLDVIWEFEEEDYQFVDVYLKNDKYSIINGSMKIVPKR